MHFACVSKLWILALGLSLAMGGSAFAQANLVANSDFEGGASEKGLPAGGWWVFHGSGYAEVGPDASVSHQGRASARFKSPSEARTLLISAPFPVAPKDELRFGAYVRAENLQGQGNLAYLGLAFRNEAGAIITTSTAPAKATDSWTKVEGKAEAPAGAVRAEIQLNLNHASGTLWYDDALATVVSPVSLSLAQGAKPYAGEQTIIAQVANRGAAPLVGSLRATIAKIQSSIPVSVPANQSRGIEVPINLPEAGSFDYTLALLDASGNTLRSLSGKFSVSAPLTVYPACPCFHAVGEGDGRTQVDALISLNPAQRVGNRLVLELADHRHHQKAAVDRGAILPEAE